MFRGRQGGALLQRTMDDMRKAIDFESFANDLGNAAGATRLMGMDANTLAAELRNSYGASHEFASIIRQLSDSELRAFRSALARSALATKAAMEQLQNLQTGRSEKIEEQGLRIAQRELQVAKERLELEKTVLKELGGAWSNFEKPEAQNTFLDRVSEAMGIMANTSRQQGSVISARHGSTMAQSLRQAGVTPQIDLNTGEFTGAFGDLFKDTVEGRMSDMVMQAQMELKSAI